MDINAIIKDAQARVEKLSQQAKNVADAAIDANKKALDVVTTTAQKLADTETAAAKDLYAVAKASFEKARSAGIKEVATKPAEFLPSADRAVKAYEDTIKLLSKGQDDLVKAAKKGRDNVQAAVTGKPVAVKKATTAAKKATTAAKKRTSAAAKKVAAAA